MEEKSEASSAFCVRVFTLQETGRPEEMSISESAEQELTLLCTTGAENQQITVLDANRASLFQLSVTKEMSCCQVGCQSFLLTTDKNTLLLRFRSSTDMKKLQRLLGRGREEERRTDTDNGSSALSIRPTGNSPFHKFHGCLSQQQNLLQDYPRTATYQRAILANEADFRNKVVLDVCCGSGILSFFAVQAGASMVYATESSPMSKYTQILVQNNHLSEQIRVLQGEVKKVNCPDMVDVIVSEPFSYMLFNRTLMGNFIHAKKWLKPNGLMFPSFADLHVAPFTDDQLYLEHYARANFWQQRSFYGVNLSALHSAAVDEFFKQPIVDTFDEQILLSRSIKHCINFMDSKEEDIHRIEIPFVFPLLQSGLIHGLAFWFDVAYQGSKTTVWLSTAPTEPPSRWSQVRCLLQTPLFAKSGQTLSGTILLVANNRQSYDINITATVDQSGCRSGNILDLKNLFFRMPFWFLW
ncbi:histone-arginine methyltransferase CARM1-like isoform X2 [Gouania willdenowi]|uniref:histone-arginine methyltransferase CARM1-like isoform X2 n=1 Tax=Gouania willdenowi TaxID=441366 RepID=UPI001056BF22|nr:histone-arginine methyltransferase CARM1-like isoform X2 [Gouania willdenowi]